jgi:hypothetical protein
MPVDLGVFTRNQQNVSPAELSRYRGQWVAWAGDGTHVVAASDQSYEDLACKLNALGIEAGEVVFDHIPDGESSNVGELVW